MSELNVASCAKQVNLTLSDSHCDPNRQTPFRVIEIGAVDGRVCQVLDVVNVNFK